MYPGTPTRCRRTATSASKRSTSLGPVEDSANGIRSALAAGLHVVAIPNRDYPPPASVLAKAQLVVDNLADLTVERVAQLAEP